VKPNKATTSPFSEQLVAPDSEGDARIAQKDWIPDQVRDDTVTIQFITLQGHVPKECDLTAKTCVRSSLR